MTTPTYCNECGCHSHVSDAACDCSCHWEYSDTEETEDEDGLIIVDEITDELAADFWAEFHNGKD